MAIGQDLLNVPMGDMIRQMAFAVADAQFELDESSMHVAEMMSGRRVLRDVDGNTILEDGQAAVVDTRIYFGYDLVPAPQSTANPPALIRQPALVSMLELGFTPVMYQFIETLIEVKIAIKITQETSSTRTTKGVETTVSIGNRHRRGWLWGGGIQITTTPVDATYSSKYSYTAEGSSLLRAKMVPVPPPPILEERIRALLADNKAQHASTTKKDDLPDTAANQ